MDHGESELRRRMADHTVDGGYFMGPQAPESDAERWARETMARPVMSLAAAEEEYRRATERPDWYHLPGRSIRAGAIAYIDWVPASGGWRPGVAAWVQMLVGDEGCELTAGQAAELKRLVGAP